MDCPITRWKTSEGVETEQLVRPGIRLANICQPEFLKRAKVTTAHQSGGKTKVELNMDMDANAFTSDADDQEFTRLVTEVMVSVFNAATASKQLTKDETHSLLMGILMPKHEQILRKANAISLWCRAKEATAKFHLFIAERKPNSMAEYYALRQSHVCNSMLSLAQGKATASECTQVITVN